MNPFPRSLVLVLQAGFSAMALDLSGQVTGVDGAPCPGAEVRLVSSGLVATTDASGRWALSGSTGIESLPRHRIVAGHLLATDRRLRLEWDGHDPSGRASALAGTGQADRPSARRAAASLPDTLVYSLGGKVFMRDTVSASRSGIVGFYDTTMNSSVVYGTFVDSRDGHVYRTVNIGSRTWMAQNLDFATDSSSCLLDSALLCARYGRLYVWRSAMAACPPDWHVPSATEWNSLFDFVGTANAAVRLRSATGWTPVIKGIWNPGGVLQEFVSDSLPMIRGTDEHGFGLLPSGSLTYETDSASRAFGITKSFGIGWATAWTSTAEVEGNVIDANAGHVITNLDVGTSKVMVTYEEFAGDEGLVNDNPATLEERSAFSVRCIAN